MSVTAFSWRRDPEWKSCEWWPQRDDDHSGMELTVPGEQLKWRETEMTLFWSISTQSQYTFSVSGYPIFLWLLEENLLRLYMKKKNYGKQHIMLNSERFQLSEIVKGNKNAYYHDFYLTIHWRLESKKRKDTRLGISLVVQWVRLWAPNEGGPGLIPDQGIRPHVPQLRVWVLQLKILRTATKTRHSQIKKH